MNHRTQIEHRGSSSFSILLYSSYHTIAFIQITYHNPFNDKILAEPFQRYVYSCYFFNQPEVPYRPTCSAGAWSVMTTVVRRPEKNFNKKSRSVLIHFQRAGEVYIPFSIPIH